jgi:transcription elongation factor SPT5
MFALCSTSEDSLKLILSDFDIDRQGEIRHIYRNFAFLYSRMVLENGGIFVCKTNHLELAGGSSAPNKGGTTPGAGFGYMSPRLSSPMHPSSGGSCK